MSYHTGPYIEVDVRPLNRDYTEGEDIIVVEAGTEIRMRLIEAAFASETTIKAVPVE